MTFNPGKAQYVDKDGQVYLIKQNLLARGWTRRAIQEKLGQPDKYLAVGAPGGNIAWGHGYLLDRVLAAESSVTG